MNFLARFLRLLVSIPFLCVALLAVLGWFTVSVYLKSRAESEMAVPARATQPRHEAQGMMKQLGGKAIALAVPESQPTEAPKEIPLEVRKTLLAVPAPLTLYTSATPPAPPAAPPVSSRYLPYGTMIPCKLVNTVDSNSDGTPVVAIVLEDMRNLDESGISQLVIPASTLAFLESTAPGRERDRIAADGSWVFVWRTRDESNGLEMPVAARALSRSFDAVSRLYRADDGRAGLRGQVIEDLGAQRINAAATAFVEGGLSAFKQYDTTSNALTGQVIRNAIPNLRNALLGGTEAYVQQYADQIRDRVKQDGAYVQVPAGTEFYLFPRETIDLRNARRGAMTHSNLPSTAKK